MPADRPDYFAFYPSDFTDDIKVEAMTAEQVGAYILLLCKAWQSDPPATLPADDRVLAKLARVSAETWDRIKAGVLAPFSPFSSGGPEEVLSTPEQRLVQKRLAAEYDKASRKIRQYRERSLQAARTRRDKRHNQVPSGHAEDLVTGHIQSKSIKKNKDKEETPLPPSGAGCVKPARTRRSVATSDPLFDRFWAAYPLKAGKAAAAQAFAKLAADEPLLARLLAALAWQVRSERWTKDGGRFIPHASTWLNGRRWEDEPPPAAGPSTPPNVPPKPTIEEMVKKMAAEAKARKESVNGNA